MNDLQINFVATMKADLLYLLEHGPDNYKPRWRNTFLVWGDDTQKPLSNTTHNKDVNRLMEAGE